MNKQEMFDKFIEFMGRLFRVMPNSWPEFSAPTGLTH